MMSNFVPPASFLNDAQLADIADDALAPLRFRTNAKATISNRGTRTTKLATIEQTESLPLANKASPFVNFDELRATLKPEAIKKLDDAWTTFCYPDTMCDIQPDSNVPTSHKVSPMFADRLTDRSVDAFEFVTEEMEREHPTAGSVHGFCVIEEKLDANGNPDPRTRFIAHPQRQNAAGKAPNSKYRNTTYMKGSGTYLSAIADDHGFVIDVYSGFSHFEIPPECRKWYRMRDASGRLMQAKRLIMGHFVSCDIMEVLSAAAIGSPLVCKPEFVMPCQSRGDVWVDDMRVTTASKIACHAAADFVVARCKKLNVRLKAPPVPSQHFTFLGVNYNLKDKVVSIDAKTLNKLPLSVDEYMRAEELYRTVGRLIFCSAPLGILLGEYYYTMKHVTAVCNKVNNGTIAPDELVRLPPGLRNSLISWIARVRKPVSYLNVDWHARQRLRRCTIFSDASIKGWGAMCVTHDGEVFITGGKWNGGAAELTSSDINWLEGRAMSYALSAFHNIVMDHARVDFRIDNTSVVSAVHRGRARAAKLHAEVIAPIMWLHQRRIVTSVSYIRSADNVVADMISRGALPTREMAVQIGERVLADENSRNDFARWSA